MTAAVEVARVLEVLVEASTTPARVETADGRPWVLKFAGAGPGPAGLLTEFVALGVARALGAPVPLARPLFLPPGFPWMAGTDEFDAMLQRSYGWNLGIALIPEARPLAAAAALLLDRRLLAPVARADGFLHNVDRTPANPNLLTAAGRLWAIDYDACLYLTRALGPSRPVATALPAGHLLAGLWPQAVPGPAPAIDFAALLEPAPEAWIAAVGVGRDHLAGALDRAYAGWAAAIGG